MNHFVIKFKKFFAQLAIAGLALSQVLVFAPQTTKAASSTVVISQVQTKGISPNDEFVELYNKTNSTIDLSTYSLHIRTSTGSDSNKPLTFIHSTISADGYFLIAKADSIFAGSADATYAASGNTLVDNGGVYISTSSTANTGIIDQVGWGTQPSGGYEGTVFPSNPGTSASLVRLPNTSAGNGTDTDNNSVDFSLLAVSSPRNTSSNPQPFLTPTLTLSTSSDSVIATAGSVQSATSYEFSISTDNVIFGSTQTNASPTATFSSLVTGQTYYVRVRAIRVVSGVNEYSSYTSASINLPTITTVTPDPLTANATYTMNGQTGILFGVGSLGAMISNITGLNEAETPTSITFNRPNSMPVTLPLVYNSITNTASTVGSFSITKSSGNQDGVVTVTISTSDVDNNPERTFSVSPFTVDTTVNAPKATIKNNCPGTEDAISVTGLDNDTQFVDFYSDSTLSHRIGRVPVVNQSVSTTIGDNMFATVYVVAVDQIGNVSSATVLQNDITTPAVPGLSLHSGNGTIVADWDSVAGATQYRLKWRQSGTTDWSQLLTSDTHATITVKNDVAYDVVVSSLDAACNESAARFQMSTAHVSTGTGDPESMSDHEHRILEESIKVDGSKDGALIAAGNDQSNQSAQGSLTSSPSPTPSSQTVEVKDRSNLIVGIAIILIIAGVAIAAYSWYQGEGSDTTAEAAAPTATPKPEDSNKKTATTESKTTKPVRKTSSSRRGGRSNNRKTRW